jgi:ABC-type multidrug transport system permease subunit
MDKYRDIIPLNPFVSMVNNIGNIIQKKKKESFGEKNDESSSIVFFTILMVIISVIMFIVYIYIYLRFVLVAFKCSNTDGLIAMFFTYPYVAWKFTDMLRRGCDTTSTPF